MTRTGGRKKWLVGFVVLLLAVSVYFGSTRLFTDLKVPLLNGATITVLPGIHLLGGLGPAAAYVVETSDGLVLIDTGLDDDAARLKAEIAKLGLDWRKLRAIFLTHVHGDHCGGAERLRAETGARIYAGQAEVPILSAGKPREAFFSTFRMPGHSPHPTTVDVELRGDEQITIGDITIRVIDAPGHTTGSACYLVKRAGRKILFSGDVIYRLGEKPLGTYSAYLAPRYRGDAEAYLATLRKLREFPVPDLVLPGHPNASRGAQSPRLSATEWTAMFDAGIHEMEQLASRHRSNGANFLDGQPRQLLPHLYYLGDFRGFCLYCFVTSSRLFVVNAPGGEGLNEFMTSRLREFDVEIQEPLTVLLTAVSENETAGLDDLRERHSLQIVASPDGVESVRKRCPPGADVISVTELKQRGWIPVTPLPLGAGATAPMAYVVQWEGRTVVCSGRIPVMVDQQSREELALLFPELRRDVQEYIASLRTLLSVKPDLWLPAISVNGQNANLYDDTWRTILERNYRIASERGQGP